ncbi:MAG TPA: VCBS domain-containing protein, partial [Sphingomicrobium sp.]|nr:VCBS domain-containing protein [Sphingomicrobium sp.]
MPTNTGGGTTTSLDNTPQAKDDFFIASEDQVYIFNVMANDLGGNAKVMWSIDNTSDDGSGDLVAKDVVGMPEYSELGARIWITADGKIAYDTNALDSLPDGVTVVDQFTYAIRMSNGTLSWATVNITLTGVNDRPVAVAAANAVNEDASVTGNVTATDADTGETATLTYALVNPAPTGLTFNPNGTYAFDASSYDSLVAGEELVLTIAFTATDVHGSASLPANLVIKITGTNDVPVATAAVNAVNEDATISGNVTASDADAGETATLTYAITGAAPTGLTFNANGTYSFDASSYDYLTAGQPLVITVPFTATDVHGATSAPANLVITVTGTNDVPVANAAVNSVNEDASISGNVTASDADAGETATLTYALVGAAPTGLTFNANGSYTFDASSYDYLAAGEPLVLTIPFTASDATSTSAPANLVITVTGTNDVPVANAAANSVLEDASVSGNVTASDADAGATATLTYALVNPAPVGLSFNADGSYSFDASSYDYLTAGEPLVLTIPFAASDATSTSASANLVITITGTNDVPVANAAVNSVLEDANISGNVTASDADAGETATLTYA